MAKVYETFDDIYTKFMNVTMVDEFALPRTPDGMYSLLENAIEKYKDEFDDAKDVEFDRDTETLSMSLDSSDVDIIIAYMKLFVYIKIEEEFSSTYDVLVSDLGVRNYKSQSDAKKNSVLQQEKEIQKLLLRHTETYDLDELG